MAHVDQWIDSKDWADGCKSMPRPVPLKGYRCSHCSCTRNACDNNGTNSDNDNAHNVHSQIKWDTRYVRDVRNNKRWEHAGTTLHACSSTEGCSVFAVVAFTPRRFVNVSTVNGNTPIEERDVKANKSGAFAFLKYVIGL